MYCKTLLTKFSVQGVRIVSLTRTHKGGTDKGQDGPYERQEPVGAAALAEGQRRAPAEALEAEEPQVVLKMPPNVVDPPMGNDPEGVFNGMELKGSASTTQLVSKKSEDNYNLRIFQSTLNLISHIFIGVTVGVLLLHTLRNGLPVGATPQHIILCVLGYQLLMAEAILSLSPNNGWSNRLRLVDKRRAHWILQLLGSGLALGGSFLKILDKDIHWNTLHGQFALVAMVFTSVSLVNGLTSLWAYELRKLWIPQSLSKLTHICFGIVAFAAASITLCYGLDKNLFRNWAGPEFTITMIVIVATFTTIIIIDPFITFYTKGRVVFKRN
ncbi:hypothetical protein MSG28_004652 [Choristoneura fumiferana]|uniref:Uncharacterized protein n=2 Tax=Choristoneura fumiferana TaxID=7141 RepID=A0ACC0K726_CHOFU|nr:hypothetical protein MSG28_004652 [Choristoneura fumiferana]